MQVHQTKYLMEIGFTPAVAAAIGPWVAGVLHDRTSSYVLAFWIAIAVSAVSAGAMWLAAPRKIRAVAGRVPRGL